MTIQSIKTLDMGRVMVNTENNLMKSALKHSQKGISPIFIIVILAVMGIGGFILYNAKNSKSPSSNNQVINQQTQPVTTSDRIKEIENSFATVADKVDALYYANASRDQADILNTTLDSFTLK